MLEKILQSAHKTSYLIILAIESDIFLSGFFHFRLAVYAFVCFIMEMGILFSYNKRNNKLYDRSSSTLVGIISTSHPVFLRVPLLPALICRHLPQQYILSLSFPSERDEPINPNKHLAHR